MSSGSSNSGKSNTTVEGYVTRILDDINFRPEIMMKGGDVFTGKIRDQSSIAKSIKTYATNPTFLKSLQYAVKQEWLILIKTKKDFNKIFSPNSRYRSDYRAPAYVLTKKGMAFAKAVQYTNNFDNLPDLLKSIISDEATDENYEQIELLFQGYDNPFLEFKKLKIFEID